MHLCRDNWTEVLVQSSQVAPVLTFQWDSYEGLRERVIESIRITAGASAVNSLWQNWMATILASKWEVCAPFGAAVC